MLISRFAVNSPVKVTMIFVGILLLGWISLTRLPTNLFPDIRAPKITVVVKTTGLSPTEVERRICEVLERSLYSIRGVTGVQSIARSDDAVVVVEFSWGSRLDFAFLEVKKAASDLQRDRADDISSLSVIRYDPNAAPIMTLALQAPEGVDPETLYRTAEHTLKPRFERLEGVANVVLTGGMVRELLIAVDEAQLLTYDLQLSAVITALQADNVDSSGGWVEEGARRYLLKSVGRFSSPEDVRDVVVGRRGDAAIQVADVATVEFAPKEAKSLVRFDGEPAVGMSFYRDAESNTVAVAQEIRREIEAVEKILPSTWKVSIANDQSTFISAAIREVRNNALIGGLLAIGVLLLFLRDFRTTLIIALAIPISIVATFNLMYFQGLSLNLMTLGGLALGCGMLVDNAIVVLENIFRHRQEGKPAALAAQLGSAEVTGALVAATLTTIAVFFPIAYVQGVAALLFKEQALTVSYSLLGSLLVALLLIPMLSSIFLGKTPPRFESGHTAEVPKTLYTRLLRRALRFRLAVLLIALCMLAVSYHYFRGIEQEFLPTTDVTQVRLRMVLPSGTPIAATEQVVSSVTDQFGRFGGAVKNVHTSIGEPEGAVSANTEDPDGPNTADVYVTLRSRAEETTETLHVSSSQFIAGLKPVLERIEDGRFEFFTSQGSLMELIGGSRAPLFIEFSGPEIDVLTRLAMESKQRLDQVPSLLNVRTNILDGAPEVLIRLDKAQLARHGLDVQTVGTILRHRVAGEVATQIRREAGDVDLRVRMDYPREDLEMVRNITFRSSTGALVRLASVADFELSRAPREIVRQRQERVAYVMADLAGGVRLSEGIEDAQAALAGLSIPPRYGSRFTGEEEQRRESFAHLRFALLLSIILVYMVMASIFESFLQPFLILFTIPLAGVGVVGGLLLTNQTLNVMSIIGIVLLGGIVVNNAIVLLDCVNKVRVEGGEEADSRETLLLGSSRRLRPVLMTTATTLLGLLPMALGFGEGAELRQAMAITVLGGLISSTLLTLFVIPCCQSYLDSAVRLVEGMREKWKPVEEPFRSSTEL